MPRILDRTALEFTGVHFTGWDSGLTGYSVSRHDTKLDVSRKPTAPSCARLSDSGIASWFSFQPVKRNPVEKSARKRTADRSWLLTPAATFEPGYLAVTAMVVGAD
jgi:hypothetical protein